MNELERLPITDRGMKVDNQLLFGIRGGPVSHLDGGSLSTLACNSFHTSEDLEIKTHIRTQTINQASKQHIEVAYTMQKQNPNTR